MGAKRQTLLCVCQLYGIAAAPTTSSPQRNAADWAPSPTSSGSGLNPISKFKPEVRSLPPSHLCRKCYYATPVFTKQVRIPSPRCCILIRMIASSPNTQDKSRMR